MGLSPQTPDEGRIDAWFVFEARLVLRVIASNRTPEIERLEWLADHGGTTEQVNARAELMRRGLRPAPTLAAQADLPQVLAKIPESARGSK